MEPEDYMRQAHMTAREYLIHAIESVDDLLGEGYAEKHPELLGQMVIASAIDYHTGIIQERMGEIQELLGDISLSIKVYVKNDIGDKYPELLEGVE